MTVDPQLLQILEYPARSLRARAAPVAEITPNVRAVVLRMIELMHEARGVGLAAPQVGLSWRLFVCHVPPSEDRTIEGELPSATHGPEVYINPVISKPRGEVVGEDEGCLSLPEITGEVLRPEIVTINATDAEGRAFTRSASGLLARCWQHELDHLDGVLIIDRMTQRSKLKNRAAVRDLERLA